MGPRKQHLYCLKLSVCCQAAAAKPAAAVPVLNINTGSLSWPLPFRAAAGPGIQHTWWTAALKGVWGCCSCDCRPKMKASVSPASWGAALCVLARERLVTSAATTLHYTQSLSAPVRA